MTDVLNPFLNSLGESPALLVYNDAHGMLGDTADSSGFAVVTLWGHSFLSSAHSLHICNITLLVDLHVQTTPCVLKAEHVASALSLSLCVCHFVKLLEAGCHSRAKILFFTIWTF